MKKNRLLSIVISVVMVIAMMPAMAFADENPLEIECQEDLERMTLQGTYTVTEDFTINTATFNPVENFTGVLDGDGHTITWNTTETRTLTDSYFGIVKTNSGTIKDLTVAGTLAVSGSNLDYVSPVAAYNSGEITGVESKTEVSAAGFFNVGGIAGFNKKTISLCRNIRSIKAMKKVGGITGENAGTIEKCYNVGDITGTDGSKNGVGGIAGRAGDNNTATETSIINDCFNWGNIACPDGKWVGGICGFENSLSKCTNCYNAGNISGVSYLDHIAGKIEGTVTNCYGLDSVSGPEGYDKATPVSQEALEGGATVGDTGKYILDLLNAGTTGDEAVWTQGSGYPYIIGNSMGSVYSFTFTGPTQTEYEVGSTFNADGLVITATSVTGGTAIVSPEEYRIVGGSCLIASQKSVTAEGTYNGFEFSIEIPIKVNGEDEVTVGTGGTYDNLADALKHVNEGGKVLVLSPVTYSPTEDVTFNIDATICRGAEFTGPMITIAADTHMVTLTTMTIDGSYTSDSNADTLIKVTSGTLRLRGNATLKNCNVAVDVAAGTDSTAELVVNRANITGSVNSIKLENTSSLFTFENYTKPAGEPDSNISGNVYLATDTYITIGAALPCSIALDSATIQVGNVVARGTSEYTVKKADAKKFKSGSHTFEKNSNTVEVAS